MVEKHNIFLPPADLNQKVWRYMDFTKMVDLLSTSGLYFCRADLFDDIFEGSLSRPTIDMRESFLNKMLENKNPTPGILEFFKSGFKEMKTEVGINCWHMNNHESAAMWKLYLKSNEGVAVQSTYSRLVSCFEDSDIGVFIGVVNYVDYDSDIIPFGNVVHPFLYKRKSFEHEKELRCLIGKKFAQNYGVVNLNEGGYKVSITASKLIEKVYVSPDSPAWFTDLVISITKRFNLEVPVINSRISEAPLY